MISQADDSMLYVAAGIVAAAALVLQFVGGYLIQRFRTAGLAQTKVKPIIPALIFFGIGAPVLGIICLWTKTPTDWVLLIILACAFALGIIPARAFGISKRFRFLIQFLIALLPVFAGEILPVVQGTSWSVWAANAICTIIFVIGVLNILEIINFLDGLSSIAIFIAAACFAAILNLGTFGSRAGDPAGVVFALALCGGSLGFVLFRRPQSRLEERDPAAMLLGAALCLLALRTWRVMGSGEINPGVLLPVILIIPILLAGIHREKMSLFRRQRLAVILIAMGQIPAWIPVALGQSHPMAAALLSIGSIIFWTAMVTQGRLLRGWSMRVMAEPITDVIRVTAIIALGSIVLGIIFQLNLWWVLASVSGTSFLLILQVTWWRRRLERVNQMNVVVFANREDYHKAQRVLQNCADLFGRHRTRRARIGLRSKHLRQAVSEHLTAGDTVVVLGDEVRKEVLGLRVLGDLIFARDCLLLTNADHQIDPAIIPGVVADLTQRVAHRTAAVLGFVFFAPAFVIIALLIKLHDGGPIFFRQDRIGMHGRRFVLYKFRSMQVDTAAYDDSPTDRHDQRITKIGRFLRRTSLDELPQLINVLRGEMRLVGPRPEMPFICARYDARERKRLEVPPGVTGLWQVSAHRNDPIHDHVEYDLAYRHARGPFLDAAIVISTVMGGARQGY